MRREIPAFLRSFAQHRWGLRFRTRAALLRYQQKQLAKFLAGVAAKAPFYRGLGHLPLSSLPVVDKATMLGAFAEFNTAGISLNEARALALSAESTRDFSPTLPGNITAGCSSGTSGQPSLFLADPVERARWAGALLGRMLTTESLRRVLNPLARPLRIAFFLRANSTLYTSLNNRRIQFQFFDLAASVHGHLAALLQFDPHVLVAPASVLRYLADLQAASRLGIAPSQVISVAETLEPDDARILAAVWRAPQQIYQCTEGVLGFTCPQGSLHLNEECVHFEPCWLDHTELRFSAILTDFSRRTQMFVRFRMDDVLQIDPHPCACGRVTLHLASIGGRQDDVLWLPRRDRPVLAPLFPDQVRHTVLLAAPHFRDYRLEQHGMALTLAVRGAGDDPGGVTTIESAIAGLCRANGLVAPTVTSIAWPQEEPTQKRRRIRCRAAPVLQEDSA